MLGKHGGMFEVENRGRVSPIGWMAESLFAVVVVSTIDPLRENRHWIAVFVLFGVECKWNVRTDELGQDCVKGDGG